MNSSEWELQPGRRLGPFVLGMTQAELLDAAAARSMELDPADADAEVVEPVNEALSLFLSIDPPHRLWQITVVDERVRLDGQPVRGLRPHEILPRISAAAETAVWRSGMDEGRSGTTVEERVSDAGLLNHGTLWYPKIGLGLYFFQGQLEALLLRHPGDVPTTGLGGWTAAQQELSVHFQPGELNTLASSRMRWELRFLNILFPAAFLMVVAVLFWIALQYQQRWNTAPVALGTVIEVQPPPPEPFPEKFVIAYTDAEQQEHRVTWQLADIYVPKAVGDTVDVRYLPEAPEAPLGPARVQDAAFLKFSPYFLVVLLSYIVLHAIAWGVLRFLLPPAE